MDHGIWVRFREHIRTTRFLIGLKCGLAGYAALVVPVGSCALTNGTSTKCSLKNHT